MKVFQDLEITVPGPKRDQFLSQIEDFLSNGWKRDKDAENQEQGTMGDINFFYFVCNQTKNREAALLALFEKDETKFYVSNIVPTIISELSYDKYNTILNDYYKSCIEHLVKELNLPSVKLTDDYQGIKDWISFESAEKLKTFSDLANKSTGSSHPSDQKRWNYFIISIIQNDDDLGSDMLSRWLIEEEGWSPDIADSLAIQFEQGLTLLKLYRNL